MVDDSMLKRKRFHQQKEKDQNRQPKAIQETVGWL